jgi:hypothetical protein
MLAHVLLNDGGSRPKVHPEFTNKNPKATTYQYLNKDEESLTRDVVRITETAWSCVRDEGINTLISIWVGMHTFHN